MADLDRTSEQLALGEQCSMDIAAPRATECVITFAVTGGIFGVGRLAARLDELLASRRIRAWHIGPWVDWRQTAIRIKFGSVEDAQLSELIVRLALQDAASAAASSAHRGEGRLRSGTNRRTARPHSPATPISDHSIGLASGTSD